jgi:hypothetical protein
MDLAALMDFPDELRWHSKVPMEINEEIVRMESKRGRSDFDWNRCAGYAESKLVFIHCLSKQTFLIKLEPSFSPQEIDVVRERLQRKLDTEQ